MVSPMGDDEKDITPDDVLEQLPTMRLPPAADPAPDDARERIRLGDVIWGLTPNGNRYLLYAQVKGVRCSFRDVCEDRMPESVRIVELPCTSTDGLLELRELVREMKEAGDVRRNGSRLTD